MNRLPSPDAVGALAHLDPAQRRALIRTHITRLGLIAKRPMQAALVVGLAGVLAGLLATGATPRSVVLGGLAFLVLAPLGTALALALMVALVWVVPAYFIWGGRKHVLYVDPSLKVYLRAMAINDHHWRIDNHLKARDVPPATAAAFRTRVFAGIVQAAAREGVTVTITGVTPQMACRYENEIFEVATALGIPGTIKRRTAPLDALVGSRTIGWTPRSQPSISL